MMMRDFPADLDSWLSMLLVCGLLITLPYVAIASLKDWMEWRVFSN